MNQTCLCKIHQDQGHIHDAQDVRYDGKTISLLVVEIISEIWFPFGFHPGESSHAFP